jgi:hypothetical protein
VCLARLTNVHLPTTYRAAAAVHAMRLVCGRLHCCSCFHAPGDSSCACCTTPAAAGEALVIVGTVGGTVVAPTTMSGMCTACTLCWLGMPSYDVLCCIEEHGQQQKEVCWHVDVTRVVSSSVWLSFARFRMPLDMCCWHQPALVNCFKNGYAG